MAEDARNRQLRSTIERHLCPSWQKYLKAGNIYLALSDVQRDIAIRAMCVQQKLELDLDAAEAEYTAPDNVLKVVDIEAPATWVVPVTCKDSDQWTEALNAATTGSQPLFCTMQLGLFLFHPAPVTAATVKLLLAYKPADDGSEDVTETTPPLVPPAYNECLIFGSVANLLLQIPKKAHTGESPEYYRQLFEDKLAKMIARRSTQARNPRTVRGHSWFPSG